MKIGIAGPMNLKSLDFNWGDVVPPITLNSPLVSAIINKLVAKGHQVVAYTTSKQITEPLVVKNENLTVCIGRHEAHAGRDLFKSERADLVKLMKEYPVDVINAQWSYEFAWAAIDSGIPTVITLRDHATQILFYSFDIYRIMRWIMNFIVLRKAKYLITNSDYLRALLNKKSQKKTVVISNFYKAEIEQYFEVGNPKTHKIVTVANGFGKRKNIDTALKAFAILKQNFPSLEYHLIGSDMEPKGKAHQYAIKNKLSEGVVFCGMKRHKEVIEMIKSAQVMLHPAREESFGNVILEAMVVGTPVVGGQKSGNVPFLLNYGEVGVLSDINNASDMAAKITKLLTDKKYAEELSIKANDFARNNYSENKITAKLEEHYKNILKANTQSH